MRAMATKVVEMALQLMLNSHGNGATAELGNYVDHVIDAIHQAEIQLSHPITCEGCDVCTPPDADDTPEQVH